MGNVRFVGLDVHADSIAIAVAEPGRGEPAQLGILPFDVPKLIHRLGRMGQVKVCYEAGPTGFGLQRALSEAGIECVVVAPSLVPSRSGDRVKTDRRDAKRLARFFRSGDLTPIHVPAPMTEAMRDLERARQDAKESELVARHQLSKFLLRHGRRFRGKTTWGTKHLHWLREQRFELEPMQRVFDDYFGTVEAATLRAQRLTKDITELIETWTERPVVKAFQALRGIDVVGAATLAAEVDDFARFESARRFMSFVGLVPSEHSSGGDRRQGRITCAGNAHLRHLLGQAAWAYRYRPRESRRILARSEGVAPEIRRIAWKAQERLCTRFRRLIARGKHPNKAVVAIARELAGFVWAIAREQQRLAA